MRHVRDKRADRRRHEYQSRAYPERTIPNKTQINRVSFVKSKRKRLQLLQVRLISSLLCKRSAEREERFLESVQDIRSVDIEERLVSTNSELMEPATRLRFICTTTSTVTRSRKCICTSVQIKAQSYVSTSYNFI